ncbi:hypothetical protein AgCh_006322 [Apium graveolens]
MKIKLHVLFTNIYCYLTPNVDIDELESLRTRKKKLKDAISDLEISVKLLQSEKMRNEDEAAKVQRELRFQCAIEIKNFLIETLAYRGSSAEQDMTVIELESQVGLMTLKMNAYMYLAFHQNSYSPFILHLDYGVGDVRMTDTRVDAADRSIIYSDYVVLCNPSSNDHNSASDDDELMGSIDLYEYDPRENIEKSMTNFNINIATMRDQMNELANSFKEFT